MKCEQVKGIVSETVTIAREGRSIRRLRDGARQSIYQCFAASYHSPLASYPLDSLLSLQDETE